MMKLPVLISYAYWHDEMAQIIKDNRENLHVMVDSGAFTAQSRGKIYKLDEYEAFLRSIDGLWDEAIQLDVIRDPKATAENFRKHTLDVMPVFTIGSTLAEIDDFPERFCIACPSHHQSELYPYLHHIFSNMGERQPHVLGFTKYSIFSAKNPPKTIDSSSWSIGFRTGIVKVGDTEISYDVVRNPKNKNYGLAKRYLQSIGLSIEELRNRSEWKCTSSGNNSLLDLLVFRSAVKYSHKVQTLYPGKEYYCAFSVPSQLQSLIDAHYFLLNKGVNS